MNKKFKIGYFADGPWSHQAFNLLNNDENIEIMFICVRYETKDETLKILSEKYKIDYLRHKNINSKDFLNQIEKYNCDLFVSMSFNQIFKDEIINMPKYKTINCHAGKLPYYRGRNILNWVLINDEKEFGITVHYVDEGIDTGNIIIQRCFEITDKDDYNALLEKSYTNCALLLHEAIELIRTGKEKPYKQSEIHPVGFYCGMRRVGDEFIDWNQTSRDIFNFIRAICKPGPMAISSLNNIEIKINKSKMIEQAPKYKGIPGQIVGKTETGFIVKTQDSTILITEYYHDGSIRIGDRLV